MFYTVKDLAARYSVTVRTIWRLVSEGRLPQPVKIGGATRWREADIAAHDAALTPLPDQN